MPSRRPPAKTPSAPPPALDAVHIATHDDPTGVRLNLPQHLTLVQAVEAIKREALRWTYLLRSRKRWVADQRARERNEVEARQALKDIGVQDEDFKRLAAADTLVVRVPWTGDENLHWESRIFPWEYVLAAATREMRLQLSKDRLGRPSPLTVMRELQRQPLQAPVAQAPAAGAPLKALFVACVPSELTRFWSVDPEFKRLTEVMPEDTDWRQLRYPTLDELVRVLQEHRPAWVHFAGLDSHQGLRELRTWLGASAVVDIGDEGRDKLPETTNTAASTVGNTASSSPGNMGNSSSGNSGTTPKPPLVDDVVADQRLMVDGMLLRSPQGLPLLVGAHRFAQVLGAAGAPAWLVTFNLWNSAARIAPLLVAEGAASAAVGFQDAFDDALADFFHTTLMRSLVRSGWNLPAAFTSAWTTMRQLPESVDATGVTLWAGAPVLPLHHSPEPTHAERSSRNDIRCTVKPYTELNYAVLHNAQPLFEQFIIECDTPGPGRVVDVDVAVHMGSETASFQRQVRLDVARVALTRAIHVPLTAEVARRVHEAISSSIAVTVRSGDEILLRDTHRLRLLPVDQWRDNRRDGRWLPSFVQPRDPAVLRAVEQAQRYNRVLRDDPNAGFEGYQMAIKGDEDSLRSVDRQVEAIWATLLHDWRLGYINPPPSYSGSLDSQRLRTPSMVFDSRSGTCIDLALLFAACLELIDIHPVIFLLEGHALPGWWRHPDYRLEYASMSDSTLADVVDVGQSVNSAANAQVVSWQTGKASHDEIRRWIRDRKLVPIETVRLTEHCGFVEAIEAGVEALAARRDFDALLEIVTARQEQVTPLPLLWEPR